LRTLRCRILVNSASPCAAEYFTDEEIDYIREAQAFRSAFLRSSSLQISAGLPRNEGEIQDDKALEKRIAEIHVELTQKPETKAPGDSPEDKAPEDRYPQSSDPFRFRFRRKILPRSWPNPISLNSQG
jgi:hypothetical protein